jgi:lysophospholipase L1-like esterase
LTRRDHARDEDLAERENSAETTGLSAGVRALALALPFVLFLIVLAGVELGVRLKLPHVSRLEFLVASPEQRTNFTQRQTVPTFEGDALLFWKLRPNLDHAIWDFTIFSTNDSGIRHREPIEPKGDGAFRIVVLGDSVSFGYRIPMVFPERPKAYRRNALPYSMQLENDLRAANPGREIDVLTLAVPGYSSHQGLAWLRSEIADLEPDLVIACFGRNDLSPRQATDRETMKTDWARVWLRRVAASSQAIIHATRWLTDRRKAQRRGPRPTLSRVPPDHYVENLLEMARLADQHGAAMVVIAPVYRDFVHKPEWGERMALLRAALESAMEATEIPYLLIPELTEASYPQNNGLFGEDIHPNVHGHRLMAERLLEFISDKGLLGNLQTSALDRRAGGELGHHR